MNEYQPHPFEQYIDRLEARNEALRARIEALHARIEALRAALREVLMTSDPYGVECICREALDKDDKAVST